jgi:hypothetical protein
VQSGTNEQDLSYVARTEVQLLLASRESDSFADLLVIFLLACYLVFSQTGFLICCFLPGTQRVK